MTGAVISVATKVVAMTPKIFEWLENGDAIQFPSVPELPKEGDEVEQLRQS